MICIDPHRVGTPKNVIHFSNTWTVAKTSFRSSSSSPEFGRTVRPRRLTAGVPDTALLFLLCVLSLALLSLPRTYLKRPSTLIWCDFLFYVPASPPISRFLKFYERRFMRRAPRKLMEFYLFSALILFASPLYYMQPSEILSVVVISYGNSVCNSPSTCDNAGLRIGCQLLLESSYS